MITSILNGLKEDRAKFARELAYIRENADEDLYMERVERAERALGKSKIDDFESYVEAATIMETMPEDYSEEDNVEIQRILESTDDLSFDEMIGIDE